jgi:hypothetical protein
MRPFDRNRLSDVSSNHMRHCATIRKVAGSIPVGVIGIIYCLNPSGRTVALESTQPLIEMSTRNISWEVKAAGAWMRQTFHLHVPDCLEILGASTTFSP